jgi:hypothetical protein
MKKTLKLPWGDFEVDLSDKPLLASIWSDEVPPSAKKFTTAELPYPTKDPLSGSFDFSLLNDPDEWRVAEGCVWVDEELEAPCE